MTLKIHSIPVGESGESLATGHGRWHSPRKAVQAPFDVAVTQEVSDQIDAITKEAARPGGTGEVLFYGAGLMEPSGDTGRLKLTVVKLLLPDRQSASHGHCEVDARQSAEASNKFVDYAKEESRARGVPLERFHFVWLHSHGRGSPFSSIVDDRQTERLLRFSTSRYQLPGPAPRELELEKVDGGYEIRLGGGHSVLIGSVAAADGPRLTAILRSAPVVWKQTTSIVVNAHRDRPHVQVQTARVGRGCPTCGNGGRGQPVVLDGLPLETVAGEAASAPQLDEMREWVRKTVLHAYGGYGASLDFGSPHGGTASCEPGSAVAYGSDGGAFGEGGSQAKLSGREVATRLGELTWRLERIAEDIEKLRKRIDPPASSDHSRKRTSGEVE